MTGVRTETARTATRGMVCTVDHLASAAGIRMLQEGGNAVDAAVAASAVLAVTTQHMCGMGGDLWAVVHHPGLSEPLALNASGRAGSGADAAGLRAEGFREMPFRGDIRSTPVPGCVDGWVALMDRLGSLSLDAVLAPAQELAELGYPASPILGRMSAQVADVEGAQDYVRDGRPVRTGEIVRRPGLARALGEIRRGGRQAWYEGEFGTGLRRIGHGLFTAADLERTQADWVTPTRADAFGQTLWTAPPNSQGYLSLAGAVIADGLELPDDPEDPLWAHLLVESAKQAAFDRPAVLFEGADGSELVSEARLAPRRSEISPVSASEVRPPAAGGGTIYLCTADGEGMGVSLIQSNAAGFGAHLTVPELGVFLHNRGIGFSVEEGHPAEYAPGRRPPSTLAPALATTDGALRSVFGCMGGDAQPQVVLQMAARRFQANQSVGRSLTDHRFALTVPDAVGFDTWGASGQLHVAVEAGSPWVEGLRHRGHLVQERAWGEGMFGHSHMIDIELDGDTRVLSGVADPRALTGAALGF